MTGDAGIWLSWAGASLLFLCLGSFLAVVVSRYPTGIGLLGRSRCNTCEHPLSWLDTLPLLSWAYLKARCRYCRGKVSGFSTAMELAALIVGLWSLLAFEGVELWIGLMLGWTLLLLAAFDVRYLILPWPLTAGLGASGIATGVLDVGTPWDERIVGWMIGFSLLAGVQFIYQRIRRRSGLGGGDVWLYAAAGAWVGWQGLPWVLLLASGGCLATSVIKAAFGRLDWQEKLPFGAWLAAAIWVVYTEQAFL